MVQPRKFKLTSKMTFSVKKILLELTQILTGCDDAHMLEVDSAYRKRLKIICDGDNVFAEGKTQEEIFEEIKNTLTQMLKK